MRVFLALGIAGSAIATPAVAQDVRQSRLARGDAQIAIGSQNLHEPQPPNTVDPQDSWVDAINYGAASVGWYWTDHLKTTIDVASGGIGRQSRDSQVETIGTITYSDSELRVRETNLDVSQEYQFFHNAWVHPHVAAGIDVAREYKTVEYYGERVFDKTTRTSRTVGASSSRSDDRTLVRPFGDVGLKAYMSRRAFFSGGMRLRIGRGIDEVRLRFGVGLDF